MKCPKCGSSVTKVISLKPKKYKCTLCKENYAEYSEETQRAESPRRLPEVRNQDDRSANDVARNGDDPPSQRVPKPGVSGMDRNERKDHRPAKKQLRR